MHLLINFDHALLLPLLVFGLESISLGWDRSSLRRMFLARGPSQAADLVCFLLFGTGLANWVLFISTFGTFFWFGIVMHNLLARLAGIDLHVDTGSPIGNFAVFYLIFSFQEYASHRVLHMDPFWNLHRYHHAATEMNPLLKFRDHPAQRAFEVLFISLPYGLVSAPIGYFVVFSLFMDFYGLVTHIDAPWRWGWFGRYVIHPPAAHRLHHSQNPAHYGKNLATLVLWDRLFGTYDAGMVPVTSLGVDHGIYHKNTVLADIGRDYWLFLKQFLSALIPPFIRPATSQRSGASREIG